MTGNVYSNLENIVGTDYISKAEHVRWTYSRDFGIFPRHLPDMVIKPRTTEEIQSVLKVANTSKVPVYVRGAGISFAGGVVPVAGGILLDLTRMDRILDIDKKSDSCLVECCTICGTLMKELEKEGYILPAFPDSALVATVGGFLATSGVGSWGSAFYGSMADLVLGLKVVLPNGDVVQTGTSGVNPNAKGHFNRYVGMPDLSGLFVGSEGTLGVITEIAFKLVPNPEKTIYFAYQFDTHQAAERVAVKARRKGLHLVSMDILTGVEGPPRLDAIISTSEEVANIEDEVFESIAKAEGGKDLGHDVAQRGYEGIFYPGEQFLKGSRVIIGGFVPLTGIGDYLDMIKQECVRMSKKYGFPYRFGSFNVLNSWDIYAIFHYNEEDPNDVEKAQRANVELQTILYETGAVPTKRGQVWNKWASESQAFELFRTIKQSLDPNNIMSPGVHGLGKGQQEDM
ncbi:MAG: FAD-binding oxidoreductase [Candidatus Thorarchaeota archaeon]|jgi:FAD/FMN-containing dehydrogenase